MRDVIADRAQGIVRSIGQILQGKQPMGMDTLEEFFALKEVNFDVNRGDRVGIIGRNGAGKSTLLKVLSRITEPTSGRIELDGRVSSLLEVGTGFHPELTGRENIFLNGAILGMNRREVKAKFDEIVDFAEIEYFLDTPVKRYSSGMYVKLAFAVAAHLDPEILIVDEVLAVGDTEFQKKCLGKMEDVSSAEGRTVLFVSHNLEMISRLCSESILLDHGRLIEQGPTHQIISNYLERGKLFRFEKVGDPSRPTISAVCIDQELLGSGDIDFKIEFDSPFELNPPNIGFVINNKLGHPVLGANCRTHQPQNLCAASQGAVRLVIPNAPLHTDTYSLSVFLGDSSQDYDLLENILTFDFVTALPVNNYLGTEIIGNTNGLIKWDFSELT